jgi:predicted ferric reductase
MTQPFRWVSFMCMVGRSGILEAGMILALVALTGFQALLIVHFLRAFLPPFRTWRQASRGLSARQRLRVGLKVQMCRAAPDPTLARMALALIAFRRQLIAFAENDAVFRTMRVLAGLGMVASGIVFAVVPTPRPLSIWLRAFFAMVNIALGIFLIFFYQWLLTRVSARLDRCETLNRQVVDESGTG